MARVNITAPRVEAFACPAGKSQAFLWDAKTRGLALRVTANGARAYVFQSKLAGTALRMTIGSPDAWPIPQAQAEARRLQQIIDAGRDPRVEKAAATKAAVRERTVAKARATIAREAWDEYLLDRAPHWGERHKADHVKLAAPGGAPGRRGPTMPGPLAPLLKLALRDLDAATIEGWAKREAATHPTVARLAWRLLKAFLGWCAEQPAYASAMPATNAAKSKRAREVLGAPGVKSVSLQREQLAPWFAAVREIRNPVVGASLQTLLLTGARPGEVLTLKWTDLDTQWKALGIRDKVEGERVIPLTPYVEHLLTALPRRSEWVFAGERADIVAAPNEMHTRAAAVAGIEGLTLHGLRRSFKSLTEWLDIPAGVVAQLMGHKPSATAERHYTVRPLDLLRVHHERIEKWILQQAGVKFRARTTAPADKRKRLRLVATA